MRADLKRLFVMDLNSKEKSFVTRDYELWVDQYEWLEGDKGFRFLTNDQGLGNLFEIDLKSLKATKITDYDMADVVGFAGNGKDFLYTLQSMKHPTDIYAFQAPKRRRARR